MMPEPQAESHWRVSLPMYNLPEMQAVNPVFLSCDPARAAATRHREPAGRSRLRPAGRCLNGSSATRCSPRSADIRYRRSIRGQAALLGAPVDSAEHCAGATHAGVFVVHRDSTFARLADLRGCNFVYNSRHSNSGMNLPRRAIAEIVQGERFFGSITETHSQPGNIERVARREADATCVDSVTYAFFCRHRPQLGELTRVLAATPPSPSNSVRDVDRDTRPAAGRLAQGASKCCAIRRVGRGGDPGLMLQDIVPIELASYGVQLQYEREAHAVPGIQSSSEATRLQKPRNTRGRAALDPRHHRQ